MRYNLIAAGCSFTKDFYQKTWADYLAQSLGYQLTNIGARGAGLEFICKRLMMSLQNVDPDQSLVAIMLPSMDRFDCYVDREHVLKNQLLEISSWQNGKNSKFVNLDGQLSDSHGYSLTGGEPRGIKKHWYKYYFSTSAAYINFWFNVFYIQNFLDLKGFKYFFTSAYDFDSNIEQPCNQDGTVIETPEVRNLVKFDQFIMYEKIKGFLTFVSDNQYQVISQHPVTLAHHDYAKSVIVPQLEELYEKL